MIILLFHDRIQAIEASAGIIATHSLRAYVFLHGFAALLDQAVLSALTQIRFCII